MPNTKPSPDVKDRDWHFLAKLLEWADIGDEEISKHLSCRTRPSWCEVSKGFKLSVKASLKELVELTGLTETQVSGAINRLEERWGWLEPFGKTQGKRIREFFLILPSRDPEAIKVLFEQKWKQLYEGESRSPLSSSTLRKLALERLHREQHWLTISRLTVHQGGEKPLESADFVAPFLITTQGEQEHSFFNAVSNEKSRTARRRNSRSTTLLSYEAFLDQIFRRKESRKSGGSRIAITGTPGAGKTTLLQHVAFWLAEELGYLPIWISLSQWCQNTTNFSNLEAYLLKSWLSLLVPNADRATQKLFEQMCVQGKVCLLIDGTDEITIPGVNETVVLNQQLKNSTLLSRMTVIMTCRTDHWSSTRNSLQLEFDTYQLLDLVDDKYPDLDQLDEFILKWFRSNPSLGRSLIQELNKQKNLEVKNLMANRLCLALLCHRWPQWHHNKGLPRSRTKLYKRYVDDFFSWKSELEISQADQKRMKQALGALAYRAFEQEPVPFQLSSRLVEQLWEERELSMTWLEILQDVGILHPIQVFDEGIEETAYTFLHPVFQEYFAAQYIDDPSLLFDPNHQNLQDSHANYYIFELKWQNVYLLWLDRDDVSDEAKNNLLENLLSIEHSCGGFYYNRACFLAGAGVVEFPASKYSTQIMERLVELVINQFESTSMTPGRGSLGVSEVARNILLMMQPQPVVDVFYKHIQKAENQPKRQIEIARWLADFKQGRLEAARVAFSLLRSDCIDVHYEAAKLLFYLEPSSPNFIILLLLMLESSPDEDLQLSAAYFLLDLESHQLEVIRALERLSNSEDRDISECAAMELENIRLGQTGDSVPKVEASTKPDIAVFSNFGELVEQLQLYPPGSRQAADVVHELTKSIWQADVVEALSDLVVLTDVIQTLKYYISRETDFYLLHACCYNALQRCAEIIPYPTFHKAWYANETP